MNKFPLLDLEIRKFLENVIEKGPRPFNIFEYGSGGSTIWYGKKI